MHALSLSLLLSAQISHSHVLYWAERCHFKPCHLVKSRNPDVNTWWKTNPWGNDYPRDRLLRCEVTLRSIQRWIMQKQKEELYYKGEPLNSPLLTFFGELSEHHKECDIRVHFSQQNIQKELPASVPLLARSHNRLKWGLYQRTDPKDLIG